jgi:hypothetical protein
MTSAVYEVPIIDVKVTREITQKYGTINAMLYISILIKV